MEHLHGKGMFASPMHNLEQELLLNSSKELLLAALKQQAQIRGDHAALIEAAWPFKQV